MTTWKEDYLAMVRNRAFCLMWLVLGMSFLFGYTFILNPVDHTISMIGLEHPWLFRLWGLVAAILAVLNLRYMMRRYDFKSKFCNIGLIVGCINIAISVNIPTTDDWGWQLVGHWGTAMIFGFSVVLPIGLFLMKAAFILKVRRALLALVLLAPTSLGMLTWLILDKGGIAQQVIMLFAVTVLVLLNYTNVFRACLPEQAEPKRQEEAVQSA